MPKALPAARTTPPRITDTREQERGAQTDEHESTAVEEWWVEEGGCMEVEQGVCVEVKEGVCVVGRGRCVWR